MKKLTTYFLSTGCIIAAAFGMSALASATVNVSPAFETVTNSEGEESDKTEYKDFDELQAALSKAKPTGELTITLNDAQSPKKSVKIPKTLDKVTLTGDELNITKAKSMSIDCPAVIDLTIDGGGKAKLATKGDVDIQTNGNINNVTALSGAKSATLKVSDNEDFNFAVSGFGTVQVDDAKTADFIGGEKGDALKVGKLELAGAGVANVYSHPVTVDSLVAPNTSLINFVTTGTENKKVAHSYITVKKEAAEANVKIDAGTKYGDAATITSVAFEPSNKVLVIKAKDFETLGISLKNPMVPASNGTKYALSNKKGTYTVKPASYTLSGTDYTTWEEVANYITENGSSDTAYTVQINYDTREEGAIKFPKKDTYKSLIIQGIDQDAATGVQLPTWAFTGGVSTTGDVVIKNVLLKSYKFDKKGNKDVAQQFALNGGKYSLTLDNVGTFTENDKPTYLKSVSADELILENNDSAGSGFTLYSLSLKANALRLGNSSKTGETGATGSIAISTAAASFKNGITNLLDSNGAEVTTREGDKIAFTFVDKKTLNAATKDINKLKVTAPAYGNQFVILNGGTAAAPKYTFAYSGKNLMPTDLSSETAFGLIKTTTGADIIMGKDAATTVADIAFSVPSSDPKYILTAGAKAQKIYFKTFKDIASYIETASKNDENAANNYYGIVIEKDEKNVDVKLPKADTYKGIVLLSGKETSDSKRAAVSLTPKSKITLTGAFYVVEDVDLKIDAKNVVNKVEADYVNKPLLKKTVIDTMNTVEKTYKEYFTAYTTATTETTMTTANLKTLKTKADANKAAVEAAKTAIQNLTFTLDSAEKTVLLKANEAVANGLATWTEAANGSKEIKYTSSGTDLVTKYVVLKNVGNTAAPVERSSSSAANAVSTYEFSGNDTAITINGASSGSTAQNTAVTANVKAKIDGAAAAPVIAAGIKVIKPSSAEGITIAIGAGQLSITTQAAAAEKDHEVTVFVPDGNSYTLTVKVVKGA